MDAEHFSREFDDAPMPHSIFFTQVGHAIHGYYNTRNIGLPASHGCVRLDPANATRLFTLVKEQGVTNTTVEVTGNAAIALANHRAQLARAEAPAAPAVASAPQPIYAPQSPYAQQTYPQQTYAQPSYAQPSYPQTYGSSSRDDSYASDRRSATHEPGIEQERLRQCCTASAAARLSAVPACLVRPGVRPRDRGEPLTIIRRSPLGECRRSHMIRKLKSGEYRLYSRKLNPKTGKRRNLQHVFKPHHNRKLQTPCNVSSGTDATLSGPAAFRRRDSVAATIET